MDMGIEGRIALVTGASKGIGRAVAEALAAEGARVALAARGSEALEEAAAVIRAAGGVAEGFISDVSDPDAPARLLAEVRERLGEPAIVVANAGGPPAGVPTSLDEAAWRSAFELTLMSSVRLAREALPAMRAAGWGRVALITSLSVREPILKLTLSNAMRSAATAWAKTLATEVAADGVTVNCVAPGYTATERLEELFEDDAAREALMATIPARRFGKPEEVAAATLFLCSSPAAYVTGQTFLVDGGAVGSPF